MVETLGSFRLFIPVLIATAAFLGAAVMASLFAPLDYRVSALRFTSRFFIGAYMFLLTIYTVRDSSRIHGLMVALMTGAGISALLGIGEVLPIPEIDRALLLFKSAPSLVGGTLRVSATFQYTTIAAMYFEMGAVIAVGVAAYTADHRLHWLALVVAGLCAVTLVLTLTRSGMAALFVTGLLILGYSWWRSAPSLRLPAASVITMLILTFGGLLILENSFFVRLTTEDDTQWLGASYDAPENLTLEAGKAVPVTVNVQNTGMMEWSISGNNPFKLAYYWYSIDKDAVIDQGHQEVDLPGNVPPGESIVVSANVQANLPPGDYRLMWSMIQSGITWFSVRGVEEAITEVKITSPTAQTTAFTTPNTRSTPPGGEVASGGQIAVSRSILWRVALEMWRERPLTGYGPDNFRLLYGNYLGYEQWYTGNHANNLYLELLATMGILGFMTFSGFIATVFYHLWQSRKNTVLAGVLGGTLVVFLMHNVFDYFLPWFPTLGFFWMVCGLIIALRYNSQAQSTA